MRTLIEKQNPDEIKPDHTLSKDHLKILQKMINKENTKALGLLQEIIAELDISLTNQKLRLPDELERMLYITHTYLSDVNKIKQLVIDEAMEYGTNDFDDHGQPYGMISIEFEYKCFLINAKVELYTIIDSLYSYLYQFELTILNP